jgi:phospholipid/cholesterol/gamma-HCH transport system permease protein
MAAFERDSPTDLLSIDRRDTDTLVVRVRGTWHLKHGMPSADALETQFATQEPPHKVSFDASALTHWDSSLVNFVTKLVELCHDHQVATDLVGLPPGLQRIVKLAETVPETRTRSGAKPQDLVERLGLWWIRTKQAGNAYLIFLGDIALAFARLLRGTARFRKADLLDVIQQCGANALGIVTLISFLVGIILAFMGAVQLQQFGASIYVADLVGIGMVREMGAMMTGIIMAGRTGAAFAAEIGTMKVTNELDAFSTMGISPIEFLVLPRMIALVLMMPLLCLYADFVGLLGGASIGYSMLGVSFPIYFRETFHAITLTQLAGGLSKSVVYGMVIAYSGCLRGFQCGNSSSAVGDAATEAVVTGIVAIVIACGLFAVIFNVMGI